MCVGTDLFQGCLGFLIWGICQHLVSAKGEPSQLSDCQLPSLCDVFDLSTCVTSYQHTMSCLCAMCVMCYITHITSHTSLLTHQLSHITSLPQIYHAVGLDTDLAAMPAGVWVISGVLYR